MAQVVDNLRHYSDVIDGILCLYAYVDNSIAEQLEKVSIAAFKLLCLYRRLNGKIIPSQLYHDLQCTFENAFFCAAKYKVHHPDMPLWLMLLGTDILERLFGNMRQKNKSGFDCLDMIYMSRAMAQVTRILDKHPDWVSSGSKLMTRLCLDYSKPSNWDTTKLTLADVDIPALWETGRHKCEIDFLGDKKCDFFDMRGNKVTLLKPNGKRKVGLTPLPGEINEDEFNGGNVAEDETQEPVVLENASEKSEVQIQGEESAPISSIIDYVEAPSGKKYDNQVQINGEYYFKASVVRQLFDTSSGSKDRLRRVQAMGRYHDEPDQKIWLDNVVMIGDPVLVDNKITVILKITKSNKKLKTLNGDDLQQENVVLSVQEIDLSMRGEMYVWTGKVNGKPMTVEGSKCNMVQPSLVMVEGKSCFGFDRSFITDLQLTMVEKLGEPVAKKRKRNDEPVVMKECHMCKKTCEWSKLRAHVGQHIVIGDVSGENVCGYCGSTCYTSLERSSKCQNEWYYRPKSSCKNFWELSKKPTVSSDKNPCTNYVEHCKLCSECVWKYNMACHYASQHPDHEDVPVLDEVELERMKDYH